MEILSTLNQNQKQAAMTIDSHVRIIAGAGSGKTRVLGIRNLKTQISSTSATEKLLFLLVEIL